MVKNKFQQNFRNKIDGIRDHKLIKKDQKT